VPRFVAAALGVAALIGIFTGAMYLRYSGNRILPLNLSSSSEFAQVRAIGCRWDYSSRVGSGPIIVDPVESTLAQIRHASPCNQPDASTVKATRSTWDTAHAIVRARGGSLPADWQPQCLPDDHTRVWLVEVRGTFVPPPDFYAGTMVPDAPQANVAPSTTPVPGTWFNIVAVLNY
jgi:hypothetical protein